MSAKQHGETCGCCAGLAMRTPAEVTNTPGLSAIVYRAGTWASFRETMLSRFATSRNTEGDALDPRSGGNFAASLADAWAVVGDILTFYQERVANESYLRTATERSSVLELARMIGYELRPGVAAETWLAFTIDDPPVLPALPKAQVASVPLPVRRDAVLETGLKVQSVPGPDEKPQTFETVEKIVAWPEWNAIPLRVRRPQAANQFSLTVWLDGQTDLREGDFLLLEIRVSEGNFSPRIRRIKEIEYDEAARMTRVSFESADAIGITPETDTPYEELTTSPLIRQKFPLTSATLKNEILTKAVGPNIVNRAWRAEDLATIATFQGWSVDELEEALYRHAQRQRMTGIRLLRFGIRAGVFGHNAPRPDSLPTTEGSPTIEDVDTKHLSDESSTTNVYLDTVYRDIPKGSWVVLRWVAANDFDPEPLPFRVNNVVETSRSKYLLSAKVTRLTLSANTSFTQMPLRTTSVHAQNLPLTVGTEPVDAHILDSTETKCIGLRLDASYIRIHPGRRVIVTGKRVDLDGELGSEQRVVKEVRVEDGLTTIYFEEALAFDYDWTSMTVNANVARATHGESTAETLGSGNAGRPYQSFVLRQKPLTHTSAPTPTGTESSLEIFVNDVRWHEAETLYGRAPSERIFATRRADDGSTTVQFGDGLTGSRVPTGIENVRARYRKGIGLEGLVHPDQLTLLLTRPLGVKAVTNPIAADGAADPEPRDEARQNAPLQVLTLGRAVSLRDFEDFARGFAGVAKSLATRISGREKPGVFVTVAGPNGAAFARIAELSDALRKYGDPFVPIVVKTFHSVMFRVEATLKLVPDHLGDVVKKAVEAALRERYSFTAQRFGQPVFLSEVISVIQSVEGVLSAKVTLLDPDGNETEALAAAVPFGDVDEETTGADLLTLDPRPVALTVLP